MGMMRSPCLLLYARGGLGASHGIGETASRDAFFDLPIGSFLWTKCPIYLMIVSIEVVMSVALKTRRANKSRPRGRSVGLPAGSEVGEIVRHVEAGFPFTAIERFRRASGLPLAQIAGLVRIPPRTLARRRARGRLGPDESERLLRIATVFEQAADLFEGDAEAAKNWLTTPKKGLGGAVPLQFARTEIGAREVELLIGRLEHGVFS
jgi:putative toxin-antitoxin system antitoxin component (TIGR02293 family)